MLRRFLPRLALRHRAAVVPAALLIGPSLLATLMLAPALPAAAQSACVETDSQLVLGWANGTLPQDYYLLAPDAAQGWQGDISGFYGTPIYYPAGWGWHPLPDGTGTDLFAGDGSAAIVLDFAVEVDPSVTSEQAAASIDQSLLGTSGTVVCDVSGVLQGTLPTQIAIVALQAGNAIALAYTFVMPDPSTGQAEARCRVRASTVEGASHEPLSPTCPDRPALAPPLAAPPLGDGQSTAAGASHGRRDHRRLHLGADRQWCVSGQRGAVGGNARHRSPGRAGARPLLARQSHPSDAPCRALRRPFPRRPLAVA
jgi:hypothetical protein